MALMCREFLVLIGLANLIAWLVVLDVILLFLDGSGWKLRKLVKNIFLPVGNSIKKFFAFHFEAYS